MTMDFRSLTYSAVSSSSLAVFIHVEPYKLLIYELLCGSDATSCGLLKTQSGDIFLEYKDIVG